MVNGKAFSNRLSVQHLLGAMFTENTTYQKKAEGDEKKHAELWFNMYNIAEIFRRILIRIKYSK